MSVPGALACGPGLALLLQMAPPDSVLLSFLLGSVIEGPSWDTGAWAKGEFRGSPPVSDEWQLLLLGCHQVLGHCWHLVGPNNFSTLPH